MADNQKYYYLKLKENFFDSDELKILESKPEGYIYSNILLKLYLKSLRNEGKLMYRDIIPYTPEVLATLTGHSTGNIEKALKMFENLGLIEILDNGTIYMMDIQNFIGKSSTEADRQREYYNRVKEEKACIESSAVSGEKSPEVKSRPAISAYPTEFEELWACYPRKDDKAQAYKKYKARLEDGFSHDDLLTAVKNYAEQCKSYRTEKRFIKLGKTFLGESTPFLDFLPKNDPSGDNNQVDDESNPFRKDG